jgi:hypothetical protein
MKSTHIYFRPLIRFETSAIAHDALNRSLFLTSDGRLPDGVLLRLINC